MLVFEFAVNYFPSINITCMCIFALIFTGNIILYFNTKEKQGKSNLSHEDNNTLEIRMTRQTNIMLIFFSLSVTYSHPLLLPFHWVISR